MNKQGAALAAPQRSEQHIKDVRQLDIQRQQLLLDKSTV